jgi:hypothetical protein
MVHTGIKHKRISLLARGLIAIVLLVQFVPIINAGIIQNGSESIPGQIQAKSGDVKLVSAPDHPVRAGQKSTWFQLESGRSEIETSGKPPMHSVRWYGWSYYFPQSWPDRVRSLIAQWHASPWAEGRNFRESGGCAGGGHYVVTGPGDKGPSTSIPWNSVYFVLQRKGTDTDIKCTTHQLFPNIMDLREKWVDMVMHAKWTGNSDGFVKIWTRVGGGQWEQKLDYNGVTWFNDEGTGPYMKYGLYAQNKYSFLYVDEYKQGDANSSFEEVAPGGKGPAPTPEPEVTHTIQLKQNWNLISLPLDPKDDDIANILAPIIGKYSAVHAWNGKEYESYYPGDTSFKLKEMPAGRGYWIFMTQAASLQIKGSKAGKNIKLGKDWNLVGYNSLTPMSAAQALASTNGKVTAVYSYNALENKYDVVETFQPGVGYWMFSSDSDVEWSLS